MNQCHGVWLDFSSCPLDRVDFFGHGDAIELNMEVSCAELAHLCDFPSRPWRETFEAGCGVRGNVTISLWISTVDLTAHIHLPEKDGHNLRLNCIVLGSDLKKMSFFSDEKGRIAVNAADERMIIVKDLGADAWPAAWGL